MKVAPLVITPGEPGGVGAEITIIAWRSLKSLRQYAFAYLGDEQHLKSLAQLSGLQCTTQRISKLAEAANVFENALPVLHRPLPCPVSVGHFSATTASWVTDAITEALAECLADKNAAMVTCPM